MEPIVASTLRRCSCGSSPCRSALPIIALAAAKGGTAAGRLAAGAGQGLKGAGYGAGLGAVFGAAGNVDRGLEGMLSGAAGGALLGGAIGAAAGFAIGAAGGAAGARSANPTSTINPRLTQRPYASDEALVTGTQSAGVFDTANGLRGVSGGSHSFANVGSALDTGFFAEHAQMRAALGLPRAGSLGDNATLARLTANEEVIWGINAHGQSIELSVNAISRTHAEADVFNQAYRLASEGEAVLIVDRSLCDACGRYGAVRSMANQVGFNSLYVITPQGAAPVRLRQQ